MLVDFNSMADASRVWVFQSNRAFSEDEVKIISGKLESFLSTWKRHGDDLKASFEIRYNLFVIISVDESYNDISGCSIDAATNLIKQLENEFQFELLNKMNTAFRVGEHINVVTLPDFQNYAKLNKITKETIVFNNMVLTKNELDNNWEVQAQNSWHSRFVN